MVKAVVLYGTPEDPDAFERHYAETHAGLGSDEGRAATGDIPNFATGGATFFFAELD